MGATGSRLSGEGVENFLDAAAAEAPVDRRSQCSEGRQARLLGEAGECRIDLVTFVSRLPCDPDECGDELRGRFMRQDVGRKAAIERVGRPQTGAGQAEIAADLARAAIQKSRRPDIGKQTDRRLRYREERSLDCYPTRPSSHLSCLPRESRA